MKQAPRDLIFDLDDTLIHSFDGYVEMHQSIAAHVGLRVPSRDELVRYGPTWHDTLARMWPGEDLDPFFARFEEIADDVPYPAVKGVPEMLERLAGRGHRLWIVTKRSRARLDLRMLQAGLPTGCFSGIFPLEDQPHPKPDPRCFEPVWRAAGGQVPALYVGDRAEDHRAATAAGLPFVAVRTGPEASFDRFPHGLDVHANLDTAAALEGWLDTLSS